MHSKKLTRLCLICTRTIYQRFPRRSLEKDLLDETQINSSQYEQGNKYLSNRSFSKLRLENAVSFHNTTHRATSACIECWYDISRKQAAPIWVVPSESQCVKFLKKSAPCRTSNARIRWPHNFGPLTIFVETLLEIDEMLDMRWDRRGLEFKYPSYMK